MTFHRILLLNRNHIGDCLFTTPAIRAVRGAYPEAALVAAVPPRNRDLLASNPCLSEVLVRPPGGVSAQLRLLREIRRRQFDLVISFQEKSLFYAALARLSGARMTVSLQHWRTQPLYHRVVPVDPDQHEVEKYYAIARPVLGLSARRQDDRQGTERGQGKMGRCGNGTTGSRRDGELSDGDLAGVNRPHPVGSCHSRLTAAFLEPGVMELHVSREDHDRAEALLSNLRIEGHAPLVGINPGATLKAKRWPVERFTSVGRALASQHDARILVLGGPDDRARATAIARGIPGAVSVAGRTRLGETAALLRRCRLLVSGDTGPLHMAVAMSVPAIGLFGPTNPRKYGPWSGPESGRSNAVVLRHPEPCRQCRRPCVHTISEEECLAAAVVWLERTAAAPTDRGAGAAVTSGREAANLRWTGAAREAWENA